MRQAPLFLVLLTLGCDASPVITCGAGTHLEGTTCVLDALADAGAASDGAASDGAPVASDGWAADAPPELVDGDPCPVDAAGNNLLSPGCIGDLMRYCSGTVVRTTDCTELGDRCVPGAGGDGPHCEGGVYGSCDPATSIGSCADADHALRCSGGYPNTPRFTYTIACASFGAGYECLTSATGEGGCYPPGTVPCDPGLEESHCSPDAASIVRCSSGLEYTVSCDDRTPGSVCDLDGSGEPVCVPAGAPRCDLATFRGSCVTDAIAELCDRVTSHVGLFGCGPGTRCRVSDLGFAACVPDEAMSCDVATHVPRCFDHDRLSQCDLRGFESSLDCSRGGPDSRCIPEVPARCGVAADCDPSSFTAQCVGNRALNCQPGGWVQETDCSTILPCRVSAGVAACVF